MSKEHVVMNFPEFIEAHERAIRRLASAITPNVAGARDDAGCHVESLTEAVMGITSGLCRIADALDNVANAIREGRENV